MSIRAATPYLILNGRAERALALYTRALGATTEAFTRFGEADVHCPVAHQHHIQHATLRVGEALIMLSDGHVQDGAPPSLVSIALDFDDETELRQRFAALLSTGKAILPVLDAPWGAVFGVVEDELGVHWMMSCSKPGMSN
jgi:PhnB protein